MGCKTMTHSRHRKTIERRTLLKGAVAEAAVGPAILRSHDALSSSVQSLD